MFQQFDCDKKKRVKKNAITSSRCKHNIVVGQPYRKRIVLQEIFLKYSIISQQRNNQYLFTHLLFLESTW